MQLQVTHSDSKHCNVPRIELSRLLYNSRW
jgi:hypothetical protein